jgi:serine/threonine-protein kinase HipA
MDTHTRQAFWLWRCLPDASVVKTGLFAIEQTPANRIARSEFRYDPSYLQAGLPALDPVTLPLTAETRTFHGDGFSLPGFLDDTLPDDWGRRVVAWRLGVKYVDTITLINNISGSGIGALQWTPVNVESPPRFCRSPELSALQQLAESIWQGKWEEVAQAPESLQLLWQAGSGVGGARPKALVHYEDVEWLLKFNQSRDDFNHAHIEHRCLEALRQAGAEVPDSRILTVGSREALLVRRFDVTPQQGRYHLMTANALLKNPVSLADADLASYEDIAALIRHHSCRPQQDLEQLLIQMLANGVIHNTDDHLRNFSFVQDEIGWRLSPAYDVVPVKGIGQYHQILFNRNPWLPRLDEAASAAKAFGLGRAQGEKIATRIREAFGDTTYRLD